MYKYNPHGVFIFNITCYLELVTINSQFPTEQEPGSTRTSEVHRLQENFYYKRERAEQKASHTLPPPCSHIHSEQKPETQN